MVFRWDASPKPFNYGRLWQIQARKQARPLLQYAADHTQHLRIGHECAMAYGWTFEFMR